MKLVSELCARLRQRPDDEGCWQVLGDVLIEHGEPRGELIVRSMVRRDPNASRRWGDQGRRAWWDETPEAMETRVRELTDEAEWLQVLGITSPVDPFGRPMVRVRFVRGFVDDVQMYSQTRKDVLAVLDRLGKHWSGELCRRFEIRRGRPSPSGYLDGVARVPGGVGRRIGVHPVLRRIPEIEVHASGPIVGGLAAARDVRWRRLSIYGRLEAHTFEGLLAAPWIENLEALTLSINWPRGRDDQLAACPRIGNLRWLGLGFLGPATGGTRDPNVVVSRSPHLGRCYVFREPWPSYY